MKEVAGMLGNTPAVARSSYVDPRVVEQYERGRTVDPDEPAEQAVVELLTE
jgi:DNA topoisomerase IB